MEFLPIDSLDIDEWYGLSGEGNRGMPMGSESYTDNIVPTMTSNTIPSGVASASSQYDANNAAWKAFDKAGSSTFWNSASGQAGVGQLQYQSTFAHIVTRYAITSHDSTDGVPKSWAFQGSNDGATWTTLDTQADITDWAALDHVRKVFDIANTTQFDYHRLDISASSSVAYVAVEELEMMESPWGTS